MNVILHVRTYVQVCQETTRTLFIVVCMGLGIGMGEVCILKLEPASIACIKLFGQLVVLLQPINTLYAFVCMQPISFVFDRFGVRVGNSIVQCVYNI